MPNANIDADINNADWIKKVPKITSIFKHPKPKPSVKTLPARGPDGKWISAAAAQLPDA